MISKLTTISSAVMLAFAVSGSVQAFSIDIGLVNGGAGPGFADTFAPWDTDRIMSTTVPMTELQIHLPDSLLSIAGFDFTASEGDTFAFSDIGTVQFTSPLPTSAGWDGEGYNTQFGWELVSDFALLGTAEVTFINAATQTVDFDFNFASGGMEIYYDETVDGEISIGSELVLSSSLTSGGGNAIQTVGSETQDAGSWVADFDVDNLLDGFWLQDDGSAYEDGITLAFSDGNINDTTVVYYDPGNLLQVVARSDGSFSLDTAPVPEPASLALIGLGLLGMGGLARRRKV